MRMGGGNMTCCCDVTRKEEGRELPGESERKGWREHERVTEVGILHCTKVGSIRTTVIKQPCTVDLRVLLLSKNPYILSLCSSIHLSRSDILKRLELGPMLVKACKSISPNLSADRETSFN